jgi:hypothetical protein
MQGGGEEGASIIGVPLNKDCTGGSSVTVNGREHRAAEKACQYNILWRNRETKRGRYSPIEISRDGLWKPCS